MRVSCVKVTWQNIEVVVFGYAKVSSSIISEQDVIKIFEQYQEINKKGDDILQNGFLDDVFTANTDYIIITYHFVSEKTDRHNISLIYDIL